MREPIYEFAKCHPTVRVFHFICGPYFGELPHLATLSRAGFFQLVMLEHHGDRSSLKDVTSIRIEHLFSPFPELSLFEGVVVSDPHRKEKVQGGILPNRNGIYVLLRDGMPLFTFQS